jgi:uncharacterized caspase-like protein
MGRHKLVKTGGRLKMRKSRRAAFVCVGALWIFLSACAPEVNLPEQYAIICGISDYPGTVNDLSYPEADAESMETLLMRKGYAQVLKKKNSEATIASLEASINAVAAAAGKDSFFLFYFSGHGGQRALPGSEPGSQDGLNEYIYLYDPGSVLAGGVSDDELMRMISRIPSRQKVVIIDACNSGGFIGDSPGVDTENSAPVYSAGEAFSKYFANVEAGDIAYTEAIVISAAGERELSWEALIYNHGVFTYFLLQTPGRADRNGDGFITASEAYYFTKNAIQRNWNPRNSTTAFTPHISGGAMDFVLFEAD